MPGGQGPCLFCSSPIPKGIVPVTQQELDKYLLTKGTNETFRRNFSLNLRQEKSRLRGNRCLLIQVKWGRLHIATGALTEKCTCSPATFSSSLPDQSESIHYLPPQSLPYLSYSLSVFLTSLSTGSLPIVQNHAQSTLCLKSAKPNQTNDTLLIQNPHLESLLFLTKPRFININLQSRSLLPHLPLIPHG